MSTTDTAAALARYRDALLPASQPAAVDVSLWVGTYPFRHIPGGSLDHLRARLADLRIERGVVSPYEAVFAENNLDAYRPWAERLEGDPALEVWPVVRPGATLSLDRLLDRFRPRGLRLLPNYHGYLCSDARLLDPVMAIARERGMVVQLFERVSDERWHWMLRTPPVGHDDLSQFTAAYGDRQPLLLSGVNAFGPALAARIAKMPDVYADVSRARGPQFVLEQLPRKVRPDRLVFGSLWPLQVIEATLWQVTTARVDEETRAAVLRGNALRLLATADARRGGSR